jgi:hypothetical protein
LGVVGGDDLECFFFLDVTSGHSNDGLHFSFVLSGQMSATNGGSELGFVCTYHPARPPLELLSVTHVYESTAGVSLDVMFGSQF